MKSRILTFIKDNRAYFLFLFLLSVSFGIVFLTVDFLNNPVKGVKDFAIVLFQWGCVWFSTLGLLYLISINRITFLVLFPLLTFFSAILAYFRLVANVTCTPMIVDATLNNDLRTSLDLVNWGLGLFVLICLILSILIARYRMSKIRSSKDYVHIYIALMIILTTHVWIDALKRPVSNRIPYVLFYSVNQYMDEKQIINEIRTPIDRGAICNTDSLSIVVILGESLRPDHLSLNGYARNTTPMLKKLNVISLPHIYTEYTYTNRSLPHILTRADSLHPELAFKEPSFISLFNHCGFETTWLANQESANTYVYFMKECQHLVYANMGKNSYNFDRWIDGELLPYLDKALTAKSPRKLVVLHTIGSHWWYNSHYTNEFQKYNPVVKSRVLSSCTNEELINSYDNTIAYTDFFLSSVINRIKDKNAIMIYLSDHGESLGENGVWLHASEAEPLHHSAAMVWMSDKYKALNPDKSNAVFQNRLRRYRTDFLFHSVLDAANIRSPYLRKTFSIFQ